MHAGGGVLDFDVLIQTYGSITVKDALLLKHHECCVPPASALLCCDALLFFEDVEVSGAYVQQLLAGFRVVLVLWVVMLLIGMIFCFAMVLIVNV